MNKTEKIAHLQLIQDQYIRPIHRVTSSLFFNVAQTRVAIEGGRQNGYEDTILLVKKSLDDIKKISEVASLFLAPDKNRKNRRR